MFHQYEGVYQLCAEVCTGNRVNAKAFLEPRPLARAPRPHSPDELP